MNNSSNAKRELVKNSYDQEKIIDIAKNNPDWHVRLAAVENIHDEDVLKDILGDELTSAVAVKAMENINDKEFLKDICLNNPDSHLRLACINRISDESLFFKEELSSLLDKMLLNDTDEYVLKAVCENPNLTNQKILIEVATSSSDESLQRLLIRKISDANVLANFALNDKNPYIRREAIQNPNLENLDVICNIIGLDGDEFNRLMAIYKIPDGESLLKIIYDATLRHRLCEIALNTNFSLNDYFSDILENETDEYKRLVAVNFIDDEHLLEHIVLNESNEDIRADAIKNNNFNNQKILEQLIVDESSPKILLEIVSKIENQKILTEYIKNNLTYDEVIINAISRVNDLELLKDLSSNPDSRIRLEAVKNISKFKNDDALLKIALTESNEEVCLEAISAIDARNDLIEIADKRSERNIRVSALKRIRAKRLLDNYFKPSIRNSLEDLPFESALRYIALYDEDSQVRKIAASKLDDKHDLDEIISVGDATGQAAQDRLNTLFEDIKRIDNEYILINLANCSDEDVSAMAKATLDDLTSWEGRIAEINEIDDIEILKDISLNDFNYLVRNEAEGRLEKLLFNVRLDEIGSDINQEKLKSIVNDESFSLEIRQKALLKIDDEDFLKNHH